jgi:sugar/nucleoside kinase (ribokinase family)
VVGDILLDVVVRLDGLIQPDTDTYGHAVVGAGGQAANVAAWIVALGGSAALVGRHLIRQELRRHGVILHSPPAAPSTEPSSGLGREGRTGTMVSVATPDGRRTMLTDRGVTADLRPDKLDPAWFEGCGWLHLPAHSLTRSPLREATLALATRLPKLPVSVDYSSVIQALVVARFRELVVSLRPAVTFANHHEADLVGPSLSRRAPASAWSSSERAAV